MRQVEKYLDKNYPYKLILWDLRCVYFLLSRHSFNVNVKSTVKALHLVRIDKIITDPEYMVSIVSVMKNNSE